MLGKKFDQIDPKKFELKFEQKPFSRFGYINGIV